MKKLLLLFSITLFCLQAHSQDILQLIGLECDKSNLSRGSYSVMYDSQDDSPFQGAYVPYTTLAVVRKGDDVKLLRQNYLIVPTAKGFRYITQDVVEELNDTTQVDPDYDFERHYNYRSSYTVPRVFTERKNIVDFMASRHPSFEDAISIHYEKILFITPDFYITGGFESEVHGGATWFNAQEISKFYKLNPALTVSSNRLTDYLDRKKLNRIVIDAVNGIDYGSEGEEIDENFLLPWGGPINTHDEIYFTLIYKNNRIMITPLTLLNGNSARSFLTDGQPFQDSSLLSKLKIKQYGNETKGVLEFISPDQTTRTSIVDGEIKVYDHKDNRLLLQKPMPDCNRLIMSEWALGRFVDKWADEF